MSFCCTGFVIFLFKGNVSQEKIVQYCAGKLAVMSLHFSILLCNFPLNLLAECIIYQVCSLYLRDLGLLVGGKSYVEQVVVLLS